MSMKKLLVINLGFLAFSGPLLAKHNKHKVHHIKNRAQKVLTPSLIDAAREGKLDEVQKMLAAGSQLTEHDEKGNMPLHVATYKKHLEVVNFFLENGVSPDVKNGEGSTALFIAAEKGYSKIVQALVAKRKHR